LIRLRFDATSFRVRKDDDHHAEEDSEETKRRAIQFVRDDLDEYPNLTAAVRDGLATARGRG
jgi:hypothetical protein